MRYIVILVALLSFSTSISGQMENTKVEKVKVLGNCGMCRNNIEKAGFEENISSVKWDKNSKIATITYNSKKTNKEDVLKKIAQAGYDSESYLAADETYEDLHHCCQYDRTIVDKKVKKVKPKK